MMWVFYIIMILFGIHQTYSLIKANKENGLFEYTVFQMYLKEKGLSDEEIRKEMYEMARIHNELWHAIGFKAITEDQYRAKIVEYRKKNHLK